MRKKGSLHNVPILGSFIIIHIIIINLHIMIFIFTILGLMHLVHFDSIIIINLIIINSIIINFIMLRTSKKARARSRTRARARARVRTRARASLLGISTGCEGTCTESVKLIECFLWGNYAEFTN
jgi:hypothetical protein